MSAPPGAPPALLQMLMQHGGAPADGPPPGPGPAAPPADNPEQEPLDLLKRAFDLLHQYQTVEPDEEDKAAGAKLAAGIQALIGKDQSDIQQAMGSPATHRLIRKAASGLAAG